MGLGNEEILGQNDQPQSLLMQEVIDISKHKPCYVGMLAELYLDRELGEIRPDTIDLFKQEYIKWVIARFSPLLEEKDILLPAPTISEEQSYYVGDLVRDSELEDPIKWLPIFNQYIDRQISIQPSSEKGTNMKNRYQELKKTIAVQIEKTT